MAYIDNSQTKTEINDAIRGDSVQNIAPSMLAGQVVPVINVNPKDYRRCNIVRSLISSNSTGATIYTTPADKDFFLVGATLSLIKDVTSTSTISSIRLFIDGALYRVLEIPGLSLTVQDQSLSLSFPTPIKVDRNTTISIVNATNVANITTAAQIIGYTVEL